MPARLLVCLAAALTSSVVDCFATSAAPLMPATRHVHLRSPSQAMPTRPQQRAAPVQLSEGKSSLPFFLDPGTKGGITFWTIVAIIVPFFGYNFMTDVLDYDVVLAGQVILVGYVGVGTLVWTGSYVFRVATKDMTYAQQLKDYENAVIQKRFEELSEEEVGAIMGEIYPGDSAEAKK